MYDTMKIDIPDDDYILQEMADFAHKYANDSRYWDLTNDIEDYLDANASEYGIELELSSLGRDVVDIINHEKEDWDDTEEAYRTDALDTAERYFEDNNLVELWALMVTMNVLSDFEYFIMKELGEW